MRVAVVDIGTNSTRLLIADVRDGRVDAELARESIVTRLGQGVDATGMLTDEAMERVFAVLDRYSARIEEHGAERTVAVLTSAVRDAGNGPAFTDTVRERYGLDARQIPGTEEAALTFLGATSERDHGADDGEIVVIDIGGGSTELVVGRQGEVDFFTSLQMGVVRMTERHLHTDPPRPEELQNLVLDARRVMADGLPAELLGRVGSAVAVAGTATSAAAIDVCDSIGSRAGGERIDIDRPPSVHGHVLALGALELQLARLAQMPESRRREVAGLHPDRAPTIVAGVALLLECVRAFGLNRVEVSEHDILRGAALGYAAT